jgi:sugar O-acyltransferase (sialic acid O-acetyltransferase NeuD family)
MSTSPRELIIYGAGGIGSEIVSMAESGCHAAHDFTPWRVVAFVDDTPGHGGKTIHGVKCLGSLAEVIAARKGKETWCHIAIGDNEERKKAAQRIEAAGWKPATVVDSRAYLSRDVEVGAGTFIGLGATVSPFVTIGRYVLINTRASVGHHSTLGDFTQLSLNASLLGRSHVERGGMVGAHSVVMSNVTVGAWATVAIGTPVLRAVSPGSTVSMPLARTIFKRSHMPDDDKKSR